MKKTGGGGGKKKRFAATGRITKSRRKTRAAGKRPIQTFPLEKATLRLVSRSAPKGVSEFNRTHTQLRKFRERDGNGEDKPLARRPTIRLLLHRLKAAEAAAAAAAPPPPPPPTTTTVQAETSISH